ncbi:cilia- and flagella-associated protein 43-like isoform X2 [Mizuhopecten yessoensis]|uniref:cilia- and flagella-associated protein 43-like isoform X2 n=1 Tax=Mizuhopecten yessoensis TaxID=6573 RepID=UPI000B45C246|nr:cilia- and flagella-associated protein 43-like isoform X2 [Mizuhopecten yessoensis]
MDAIGSLELSWAQGYSGSRTAYVDKDVLCYLCGSNVKFVAEDGMETVFNFKGNGVGPFAVHPSAKCFAVAEKCLDPKIFIFVYPTFRQLGVIEGGTKLEYNNVMFSTSEYLATISGIPDFELTIWNYTTGTKLTSVQIFNSPVKCMQFNPGNWRQICIGTEKELTVWQMEQSNEAYMLQSQKIKLPHEDSSWWEEEKERDQSASRASTRMSRYTVDVPKAAIAGLVGDMDDHLEDIQDRSPRVAPSSVAWTTAGDIYVGCRGGHLLKIDGETFKARVVYHPPPRAETPFSRVTSAASASRGPSMADLGQSGMKKSVRMGTSVTDDLSPMMLEGSLDCIGLHRKGLYAAGQDGILRLINLKSDEFHIIEQSRVGFPVSSLAFSHSFRHMALGSTKGSLFLYEPGAPESMRQLKDTHYGNYMGMSCLSGNEYIASVREDGEVQVWSVDKGFLQTSISVGLQAMCIACSPMVKVAAVGAGNGTIYFIDLSNFEEPRMVSSVRMFEGPITHLVFEHHGRFLLTGSDDGNVFILDGRPSKNFCPIGFTSIVGEIQSISAITEKDVLKVAVTANNSGNKRNGATNLITFEISEAVVADLKKNVHSLKYDFKDDSIKKLTMTFSTPSYGAAIGENQIVYTMAQNSKKIHQINLPAETPEGKPVAVLPEAEFLGHQLPGGKLQLSPHGKWLATCGSDGSVMIRSTTTMDRFIAITPHDFHNRGVNVMVFSEDGQNIFTTGYDGILTCYTWNFTSVGIGKAKSAMEASRARKTKMMTIQKDEEEALGAMTDWMPSVGSRPVSTTADKEDKVAKAMEMARETDEIYTTPTPVPPADATWLNIQSIENLKKEDNQFADVKQDLRMQIREMRRTIQGMLKQNEVLPDIEKLGRHEFDLDIEEQNRLQQEADAEVQRVEEEIEFDNLAKIYLREMIKKECWDEMKVKGRSIQAFRSTLEVSNFPMRERTLEMEKLLQTVTVRRQIEVAEIAARKAEIELPQKPTGTTTAEDDAGENEDGDVDGKDKPSTTGSLENSMENTLDQPISLGAMFGGANELFYSQFDLHTREQKITQIILLEDALHRIKLTFNKDFDEVYQRKLQDISKIKEKNKKIIKNMTDLSINEELIEPTLSVLENPESILTVDESEVKVEKYLTPAQKKQKEKQDKLAEERRAREKGDNARERGLDMMMGGVLEIKKEDELKKDVPKPAFMSLKEESEWTEDEQKAAKEYERKVKELTEEREKYRKQLEAELRKMQGVIHDSMTLFDETLNLLFMKKIKVMMVLYQEELKILRLRNNLLLEEELETRERDLNHLLEHKKSMKMITAQAMMESKKHVDAFREQYDILLAEDKVMDRSFKREFHDVTALQQDQLYRLFRKRPKVPRLKGFDAPAPSSMDHSVPNPFADRPSTASFNTRAKNQLENSINDLDKDINAPEGIEPHIWQRLCKYRREKIENDVMTKEKALVLAEMEAFLRKRQDEDEQIKNDIDGIYDTLNKLKDDRQRFNLNLEVQLMLKQGQVEVDTSTFIHDYKDSALIHRSVVEELNSNIKQLGESKIASMVESKDFRKGIIQLEWEHKKMIMQMEDFQNRMKDIQYMKVTREIQLYLSNSDYDGRKQEEIGKLEQTILTQLRHHERKVAAKKQQLRELGRSHKSKDDQNRYMDNDLTELHVTVNERRHIDDVNADRRSDFGRERRYQEIVQRRKLVDLAKAQAQEVAVLRAEVERLRMRTFPALVQVEH